MFASYRIVTFSPAGRARNVRLLHRYLSSFRHLIDAHEWWVNTPDEFEQNTIAEVSALHPSFYRAVEIAIPYGHYHFGVVLERLREFYRQRCCARDTIYIKIDDDFCYIGRDALHDLIRFRIEHPDYFLVCPPTVNSVLQNHILQRTAQISRTPAYRYDPSDNNGYASGETAQILHQRFLASLEQGPSHGWEFPRWELGEGEHGTIGATCFFGRDFADFGGEVTGNDEEYLMCVKPRELDRVNAFAPCRSGRDAFFAHYAYAPQKAHLDSTDVLSRYEKAATDRGL